MTPLAIHIANLSPARRLTAPPRRVRGWIVTTLVLLASAGVVVVGWLR